MEEECTGRRGREWGEDGGVPGAGNGLDDDVMFLHAGGK